MFQQQASICAPDITLKSNKETVKNPTEKIRVVEKQADVSFVSVLLGDQKSPDMKLSLLYKLYYSSLESQGYGAWEAQTIINRKTSREAKGQSQN